MGSTKPGPSLPSWWKEGTAYQIWPASYKDSNGDGIGDIPGAISTLGYLKDLGVDIVWMSPMYKSPQKDYGYDISDYEDVHPPFGTLQDMETLLEECHKRDMKLLLDLVINHTSDQHAWFLESRADKTNDKADWFIWKDPKIDQATGEKKPPNNWAAIFGGSAWEYVPERDQYYLHLFVPEQPDLNWENPIVRKGIYKSAIEFWLDRGLDGFRVDTANLYSKVTSYPDAPVTRPGEEFQPAFDFFVNGPRIHEFFKEIRRECVDNYSQKGREIVLVGECAGADAEEVMRFVSAEAQELNCLFDFDVVSLGGRHAGEVKKHQVHKHHLPQLKEAFQKVQDLVTGTDAWGTVFLENHDQGRSLSRFATDDPKYSAKAAKMLSMMLCGLTGSLFIYQGQEIGMVNAPRHWDDTWLRDVDSLNYYHEMQDRFNKDPVWMRKALDGIRLVGRDNSRLPVQWTAEAPNAGFTDAKAKPWIPMNENFKEINVQSQVGDKRSPLTFWKKMIQLRKERKELMIYGEFECHDPHDLHTFTYVKRTSGAGESEGEQLLVVLNFSDVQQPWEVPPALAGKKMEVLVSNADEEKGETVGKYLTPWEGRCYLVS